MIRKNLLVCVTVIGMIFMITACGSKTQANDVIAPIEETTVEVETATEAPTYEIVPIAMPYTVSIKEDCILMDNPEASGKIVDLSKDTIVTITGDVTYGGVVTDFYYARTEDSTEGFVDGKYIDFNASVENEVDYADTLVEVEEPTDVAEEVEIVEDANGVFEPVVMYTNTKVNVRSQASKDSDLIDVVDINTEVTVTGIEGDWSQIEHNGVVCYVKSCYLGSTKTEVQANAGNNKSDSSANSSNGSDKANSSDKTNSSDNSSSSGDMGYTNGNEDWSFLDSLPTAGDIPVGSGNTGATTDGSYGGAY